ncbi:MAG: 2-hydroxychromene-2-carboxylate isomerase [Paracoccaceae bacterium]|nr:2-hydroxychromene-2-carboxylate isomerase [Paracoccaceae bacterium]
MAHIDYYFATISPSAYIAGTRLEQVVAKHGASVTYKPVDIMGLFTNMGGQPPGQRHPSRQEMRLQELRRQAKKAGLPINLRPAHFPTNGAPAAYAIIAAQEAGGGDLGALCHGVLRACWAEEKDIAEDGVIRACLDAAGFDPGLADSGLLRGAEVYERNLQDAITAGVFGSPFYVVGDEKFWGQDRIEDLDLYLSGEL